jgi:hypothetical protein
VPVGGAVVDVDAEAIDVVVEPAVVVDPDVVDAGAVVVVALLTPETVVDVVVGGSCRAVVGGVLARVVGAAGGTLVVVRVVSVPTFSHRIKRPTKSTTRTAVDRRTGSPWEISRRKKARRAAGFTTWPRRGSPAF